MKTKRHYFFGETANGGRVISAKRVNGGIELREECDGHFRVELDAQQLEVFFARLRSILNEPAPINEDCP